MQRLMQCEAALAATVPPGLAGAIASVRMVIAPSVRRARIGCFMTRPSRGVRDVR